MKKILVATDYSKEARHALLFALQLARRAKAEIVLFHAFHQPLSVENAYHLDEAISQLEKEKNKILEDYAREVKFEKSQDFMLQFLSTQEGGTAKTDPVNVTKSGFHTMTTVPETETHPVKIICVCKFGLPVDTTLEVAQVYGVDLVIMGMRGAGPVSQAFLGSTVADLIQAGTVPVLALPLSVTFKDRPRMVFALDLATLPDRVMLSRLRSWIKVLQADLKVLHLYQDAEPQQEQEKAVQTLEILDKELYDVNFEVYFEQRQDIARGIGEFIKIHKADLLALVPKHHTFLEILFQHTITGVMAEQATIPLLTLPYSATAELLALRGKKKIKAAQPKGSKAPSGKW